MHNVKQVAACNRHVRIIYLQSRPALKPETGRRVQAECEQYFTCKAFGFGSEEALNVQHRIVKKESGPGRKLASNVSPRDAARKALDEIGLMRLVGVLCRERTEALAGGCRISLFC